MANYCVNRIYFCVEDKAAIEELFHKMRACFENLGYGSVYDLFRLHGYSEQELYEVIDKRDDIIGCDGVISSADGHYYFSIETQTAWMPHIDNFYKLIGELYGNKIRIIYCAEEEGCEVFLTNDFNAVFFKDRFRLSYGDSSMFEVEYFTSFSGMLGFIKKYLCDSVSELDGLLDLERKVVEQHIKDDDCYYCRINRFEFNEGRSAANACNKIYLP